VLGDAIEQYLSAMVWPYSRFEGNDSWVVVLDNSAGRFYLSIEIHNEWFVLTVNPLVENINPATLCRLSYHLCRLNSEAVMTKAFIDEYMDLGVVVELPTEVINESVLRKTIRAISSLIEKEFDEIKRLSLDSNASSRFLGGTQTDQVPLPEG
jgi:hypothetical protein